MHAYVTTPANIGRLVLRTASYQSFVLFFLVEVRHDVVGGVSRGPLETTSKLSSRCFLVISLW